MVAYAISLYFHVLESNGEAIWCNKCWIQIHMDLNPGSVTDYSSVWKSQLTFLRPYFFIYNQAIMSYCEDYQ